MAASDKGISLKRVILENVSTQRQELPYFLGLAPRGAYRFLKFLVGRLIEQGR